MKTIIPTKKGCLAFILVLIGMLLRQYLKGIKRRSFELLPGLEEKLSLFFSHCTSFLNKHKMKLSPWPWKKYARVNELFVLDEIRPS